MNTETLTPSEVRTRGFQVLNRELGTVGFLKFMHQFEKGRGDYSRDRHALVDSLTLDTIMDGIKRNRVRRRAAAS
jgi:hypothetical protein